ncbi:hypothetical protein [Bacillus thuringiensis]|uniref:hypothetical protein n=1 Tax=Bacillus thuringiensis TaxID=1428 RepID=UPI0011239A54|nr:hypothetical protein [Bacillus thuringiensis]
MNTEGTDAYLAMVQYQQEAPFHLKIPAKLRENQAKLQIQFADKNPVEVEDVSMRGTAEIRVKIGHRLTFIPTKELFGLKRLFCLLWVNSNHPLFRY